MTGNFIQVWEYLWLDLWSPIGDFSPDDVSVPQDLFSILCITADDYLSPHLTDLELEEIRNDPIIAHRRFQSLKGTDFKNEIAIVNFLEETYHIIKDFEIAGFENFYKQQLIGIIRKFNLRYRVDDPFIIRFLLPGSFNNLYSEIVRINTGNPHLSSLLDDFEKAYDRYTRTQDPTDLKTCIQKASNYAEGLGSLTCGHAEELGKICNYLKDWPHNGVRDSLQHLYRFCNDYPGIRHGGNQHNACRPLAPRDAILTSLIIMSFSGYLSLQIDEIVVLGV
jgi:hypothetical protein